jgi:hypothetical protein
MFFTILGNIKEGKGEGASEAKNHETGRCGLQVTMTENGKMGGEKRDEHEVIAA